MLSADPNTHETYEGKDCVSKEGMWLKDHHEESWESELLVPR